MIVKNLTNEQQGFKVKELTGDHTIYDMYLQPHGATELNSVVLVSPEKYAGILEINGAIVKPTPIKEVKVETPVVAQVVEEVKAEVEEVVEEVVESEAAESFICDICGAEFASARGLNAHKNKAHAE